MATERIVGPGPAADDEPQNWALRPTRLAEYIGQPALAERLEIAIEAVRLRDEPLEHVLLHGPPGLGKTTLAHVIAAELGTRVHTTSGPALTKGTDLVAALTGLGRGDVLFIDEIHRLPIAVEEFIYPAMEEFKIDVRLDSGLNARTVTIRCQPFTLIGATTRAGLLSGPMRSRFGLAHHLEFYSEDDLLRILHRSCGLLGIELAGPTTPAGPDTEADPAAPAEAESALRQIAARSRGTPRIANRLLRRVRDFADVRADGRLTPDTADAALTLEGIDALGLDELDRAYLRAIAEVYEGGPVGLAAVAATMNEDAGTLEDVVEPFLLQIGFLARTSRGRQLTRPGAAHLDRAGAAQSAALGRPVGPRLGRAGPPAADPSSLFVGE